MQKAKRLLFWGVPIAILLATPMVAAMFGYRMIYNGTPSLPIGFYLSHPCPEDLTGELVLFNMPKPYEDLALERGYIKRRQPQLKPVYVTGMVDMCDEKGLLKINDHSTVRLIHQDSQGRSIPMIEGCVTAQSTDIIVLIPELENSFDSRVYGPIARDSVISCATKIG